MSKQKEIEKAVKLTESIRTASQRMGSNPVNVPEIEIDLMLRDTLDLYATLQNIKNLNLQPSNDSLAGTASTNPVEEKPEASRTAGSDSSADKTDTTKEQDRESNSSAEDIPNEPEATKEEQAEVNKAEPVDTGKVPTAASGEETEEKIPDADRQSEDRKTADGNESRSTVSNGGQSVNQKPEPPRTSLFNDDEENNSGDTYHNEEAEENHIKVSSEAEEMQDSKEENSRSVNDKFYDEEKQQNELGERFKNKPISNLRSVISLNQKMGFIRTLFDGEEYQYRKAIDFINKCGNYAEAKFYMENELKPKYNWDTESDTYQELKQLVYRRFI